MNGHRLLQVVAGSHVFRVELEDSDMVFIHASPGTGTRATKVDVRSLLPGLLDESLFVAFTWSPEGLSLHVGIDGAGALLKSYETYLRVPKLWVDASGGVLEVGSEGVDVMGARVWVGGRQEAAPPALELWSDTRSWARRLLEDRRPESDYVHEVAAANAAFVCLVSGIEVYLQGRFVELEGEGIEPNFEAISRKLPREMKRTADAGPPCAQSLAAAMSFQDWAKAKSAYSSGYGIRFGKDLGLSGSQLERIQRLIRYRHRIIHVEPMAGLLNPAHSEEPPEFSNEAFVYQADSELSAFVDALHAATLRLRSATPDATGA